MTFYQLTPWARRTMRPEVRDAILAAEPKDMLVRIGRGASGWACRLIWQGECVGEHIGASSIATAYALAFSDWRRKAA